MPFYRHFRKQTIKNFLNLKKFFRILINTFINLFTNLAVLPFLLIIWTNLILFLHILLSIFFILLHLQFLYLKHILYHLLTIYVIS